MTISQRILDRLARMCLVGSLGLALPALVIGHSAQAGPIISNAQFDANGHFSPNPISDSLSNANVTYSAAAGFVAGVPTVTASATSLSTSNGALYGANSYMSYYFAVTGASGPVHLLISASATSSGFGYYNSTAQVDFYGPQTQTLAHTFMCNGLQCPSNGTPQVAASGGTFAKTVSGNTAYEFIIQTSVSEEYFSPYGTSSGGSAMADPTVIFDPAFTTPTGAQIQFSSNLIDPSAVVAAPEPGSLTLLVFGLIGLVGFKLRAANIAG